MEGRYCPTVLFYLAMHGRSTYSDLNKLCPLTFPLSGCRCDYCTNGRYTDRAPPPVPVVEREEWIIPGERKHVYLTEQSSAGSTKGIIAHYFRTEETFVLNIGSQFVVVVNKD